MRSFLFLVLLSCGAHGQGLAAVISPNPAPVGTPVTITVTNGTGGNVTLPTPCPITSVHAGSPSGPVLPTNVFCLTVLWPLAPCQTISQSFNPPPNLPAGTYWMEVRWYDSVFSAASDFFSFNYQPAGSASLNATSPARIGQDLTMSIVAPSLGGASYFTGASLTTNVGFSIPGGYCSLDPDFLFLLSFPSPNPLLFSNFQGALDPSGNATAVTVHIPNLPVLLCTPLHVQTVLLGGPAGFVMTNAVNATIGP